MLEILLLVFLCTKIGKVVKAKGYPKLGFQIGLAVLWFGSEFVAGFLFGMLNPNGEAGLALYGIALGAAALSAVLMFIIAYCLPDNSMPEMHQKHGFDQTHPNIMDPSGRNPNEDPSKINPYSTDPYNRRQ